MEKTTGAVNLLNLTAQAGLANLPNIGNKVQSTNDVSFSETLMKTTDDRSVKSIEPEAGIKKTVLETGAAGNKNIKTADKFKGQETSLDEDKVKDVAEVVSKAADEVKDKIKSEFDVSDEDIENAMEVLGLTVQDLFNPADLRSLVMELTETPDSIELLTNVELYDSLKEVTSFAENVFSEVSDEFNITEDDLAEIINTESFDKVLSEVKENGFSDAANEIQTNAENTVDIKEMTETVNGSAPVINSVKDPLDKADTDSIDTLKTTAAGEQKEESVDKSFEVTVEVEKTEGVRTSSPIQTETPDNNSFNQGQNEKKQSFDNSKSQEINVMQTETTTQTVNTVGDVIETVTSYTTNANAENIMRQVTDYVRVNISGDVTKMEMQLHPASLGTVNMQINSQNGQITAHLTVQNELVKSVLESQMIKLQETFNEQGSKVTAIEVTVANENLFAQSDNSYSQQREGNQGSSKRRSINLNEIGSLDELAEEDQLEAKVMEMNGSSVNYTA